MQNGIIHNDEKLIVAALSKGSILAFNTLFYKYSGRLYRFALGYLKSEKESEDIIQEVFTKIWERRSDLKNELSFKSYLFTITFNLIQKHFRTRAFANEYLRLQIDNNLDYQTSHKIIYNSLLQHIRKLVNQLPEKRKEVFIKSRFEGLTIKEIAEDLKISHKTVENQLSLALKFIRKNIEKENLTSI